MRRTATTAVLLMILGTALSGCGFPGLYNLPLPGGADVGDHPYHVTAQFADVLDLVPQAAVKVNDVAVGRVTGISLPAGGWTADVTMLVNGAVRLPANTYAWLEQSSLLGEKYVQLVAPTDGTAIGTLTDNAVIPLAHTNRNPEVEEVFGALSMLLNGGGIGQLQTISQQLNNALRGNEPEVRAMLGSVDQLVSNLDGHRQDIADALDGVNRLAATLAGRDRQIGTALDTVPEGLAVLNDQRAQLVTMLRSLDHLSQIAVRTVNAGRADLVADLQALAPTLQQLGAAGQALPRSLQVLVTFPFTDQALNAVKGDYLNVYASIVADPHITIIPPIGGAG